MVKTIIEITARILVGITSLSYLGDKLGYTPLMQFLPVLIILWAILPYFDAKNIYKRDKKDENKKEKRKI